jgi:hypothetical protein
VLCRLSYSHHLLLIIATDCDRDCGHPNKPRRIGGNDQAEDNQVGDGPAALISGGASNFSKLWAKRWHSSAAILS